MSGLTKEDRRRERDQARYKANPAAYIAYSRQWKKDNPERARATRRKWRKANRERLNADLRRRHKVKPPSKEQLARQEEHRREKHVRNPARRMWVAARTRSKRKGMDFDISFADISVPNFCPVLGLRLEHAKGAPTASSPSLDRIDNSKGYVRGNIRVISRRANFLKNNATVDELRAVLNYVEAHELAS